MNQMTAGNQTRKKANGRLDPSRLEERQRRRHRRRIRKRIGAGVLVLALCAGSFFAGRCTAPKLEPVYGKMQTTGTESEPDGGVITTENRISGGRREPTELSDEEKRAYVMANPKKYPEFLRMFLETSPEAVDFVYAYPEYKNAEQQEIDLSGEYKKGEIPLFIQWDKRWGYEAYGDDLIALSGCGPTCLSMVYVGLTGDTSMDPRAMARFSEENGYYLEDVGTSWDLMGAGAKKLGLSCEIMPLNQKALYEELDLGHPLILSMRPGDFTDSGHFIVVYGREGDQLFIHDPNSQERSSRTWSYSVLEDQIKSIWSYGYSSSEKRAVRSDCSFF